MLLNFLIVGLGGAIGAMLRHGVGLVALRLWGANFPWATLGINITGSLCIGVIAAALALLTQWSQEIRLFAVVGVLGGFTTFSAFSLDTVLLIERGELAQAVGYVAASVVLSILATCCGLFLVRAVAG